MQGFKNFYTIFYISILCFNAYSMEFGKITVPLEIFSNILNCCFRIPTHVEEILDQDKKFFSYRLVSKQWENCFNDLFLIRLNTIQFESMERLFVQERHWSKGAFERYYTQRINYLKTVLYIHQSQSLLEFISNEKLKIDNYIKVNHEYDKTIDDSIFDWKIVGRLSYEREWSADPRVPSECSFDQIYRYFANRGFISKQFIKKLISFLIIHPRYENKNCIKKDIFCQRDFHSWESVVLYVYFYCEEFNKNFLNMNFSYFCAHLLLSLNQSYNRENKNEYAFKKVFEDFKNLDFQINYGEFIKNLKLSSYEYKKNVIKIFFNKFRNYFFGNYFELNFFLQKLLLYRLRYYKDYNNNKKSIYNINKFILCFITEFKQEILNFSIEQKERYYTLFHSNDKSLLEEEYFLGFFYPKTKFNKNEKPIDPELHALVNTIRAQKHNEWKEKAIAQQLNEWKEQAIAKKRSELKEIPITEKRSEFAPHYRDTKKKTPRIKKILICGVFFIFAIFFIKCVSKLYKIH